MNIKIYKQYILKSFLFYFLVVSLIFFILSFFLNILEEIIFLEKYNVSIFYPLLLTFLNTPSILFEIFPFIFLISTQLFYIKLFTNNEIQIFKYSGLKNSKILFITSLVTFIVGLVIISIFYNASSNLKNFYLEIKSKYSTDGKYLAVITKNGLWIKDKIDNKTIITNSYSIDQNYLTDSFITEFDEKFNIIRNIQSKKIDISKKNWKIIDANIYKENEYINIDTLNLKTNFDINRIQTLYSNLSALNFVELYQLRENYKKLNYSIIEVDMYLLKLFSYPLYLLLITLFAGIIMLNIKEFKSTTFKILVGLFFSVIIYYLNNFSYVLGTTERISIFFSVFLPMIILLTINAFMLNKINEK